MKLMFETQETLEQIRAYLGDCHRCRLCETRRSIVFGSGDPHAALMIVGEAPGFDEDVKGEPFVGRAGKELMKWLTAMHLTREQVYIANTIKCRPPDNRTPYDHEQTACFPFLRRQIVAVAPRVILALGSPAIRVLTTCGQGVSAIHGKVFSFEGIPLISTFHPAAVLRDRDAYFPNVVQDLIVLVNLLYRKGEKQ